MKTIVIVKHTDGRRCMFEVPGDYMLTKGDTVLCETKRGEVTATCVTDTLKCCPETLDAFAELMGATFPLKKILGKYKFVKFEEEN